MNKWTINGTSFCPGRSGKVLLSNRTNRFYRVYSEPVVYAVRCISDTGNRRVLS